MSRNLNNITQTNGYNVIKPFIEREWSDMYQAMSKQGTGEVGKIIPVFERELIPGQKVSINQTVSIQFTPWMTNLMHELKGELMTFFVPYRICAFMRPAEDYGDESDKDEREEADHLKWAAFITGGKTGKVNLKLPTFSLQKAKHAKNGNLEETLIDYFGMPTHITSSTTAEENQPNVLALNAYNLIYNTKLRNPDFTDWKNMIIDDNTTETKIAETIDTATAYWNADRFTRARAMQSRGVTPTIPIGNKLIELYHEYTYNNNVALGSEVVTRHRYPGSLPAEGAGAGINLNRIVDADEKQTILFTTPGAETTGGTSSGKDILGNVSGLRVDKHTIPANTLTTGLDLNEFLYQMGIMRYQTNMARIEPRLTDFLQSHFGIIPQDSRFDEPEFISSESFGIGVDTVTATATTTAGEGQGTYQGNITSQGWGAGNNLKKKFTAQEHGLLMTVMIIRPMGVYEGGLDRYLWGSRTRFDFVLPELVNLPDEKIYKGELHFTGVEADDKDLFGWEQMYDFFRTMTNKVTGKLRPSIPSGGLPTYTLARYFASISDVELNDQFLKCEPEMNRIKQYRTQPDFIFFVRTEMKTAIMLPIVNDPINLGIN